MKAWIALGIVLSLSGVLSEPVAASEGVLRQRLSNGLTVILQEDHSRSLIGMSLCVQGGSRTETPEISGLSHFYEHLMFRGGSKDLAPLEFRRRIRRIGEESGGYTTDDYTNYGLTVPKEAFDEAFGLATDAWLNLEVTPEKIDTERQVVLEEYNQDEDRPDDQVYDQLLRLVYQVHPYRTGPIGLRPVIEGANLETFRTFYADRYVPNQMILSLVGDFDQDSMLARIGRTWGRRPGGRSSFDRGLVEPPQNELRLAEKVMKTSTSRILLAFPIPPAMQVDIPALEMTATLLGEGQSSRLWRALKVEADLAVSVSAWVERRVDPGLIGIALEVEPAKTAAALSAVTGVLARLKSEPPLVDEVGRVRATRLAAHERSQQTVFDRAQALGVAEVLGSAFEVDRYPSLLQSVGRDDISRVVATYLRPDRASLSIVRPDSAGPFDPAAWSFGWKAAWGPIVEAAAVVSLAPERTVLPNGVTLIVQSQPTATMVAATILIKGGLWAEPPDENGVANFMARLLDRGAMGNTQTQIADRLGSLGAALQISGGPDYTTASLEVPPKDHRAALEILADVVTAPTFPPPEVEKMRQDLLASIRSLPDRPFENTNRTFYSRLYKKFPYHNPVTGTEESIRQITGDQIRDFFVRNVVGNNLVVVVTGPVSEEMIRAWAQQRLGRLSPGRPVQLGGINEEAPRRAVDTLVVRGQEQTTYNTGWPAVSVRDRDYLPLRLAVGILSDRLFYKYVYEKGVAYRSWFRLDRRIGQTAVMNEMGVSPGVYRSVAAEVLADIAQFVRRPVSAQDLEQARERLTSQYYLGVQTGAALAGEMADWEISGRGLDAFAAYPARLRQVTPEEVERAARKYLLPGRYTRVAVGNAGK